MASVTYDFGGAVALVTGAAGDFGSTFAEGLAAGGARLALLDLPSAPHLAEVAERCRSLGAAEVVTCGVDVTDETAVDRAVGEAADALGPATLVANNAGYQGAFATLVDYPADDFRRVLEVNVVGAFNVLRACAAAMNDAGLGGSIVNTASMAGVGGAANMVAYASSKAAVIGMTMAASKDLAPAGIRVNAVSPAFIGPGAMWDRQVELQAGVPSPYYADDPETVAQQMIDQVPLRRVGTVDEVAATVLWLLADASSYLTGQNLLVTGGIV
ncbi:MAG: SDR family oxidoreductase [Actinomycetota bacterium]|nr:SDR family oxidoreductase [Actinomycetota bacterium]